MQCLNVAIGFHSFNIFLLFWIYLSISHCEACICSCLLTTVMSQNRKTCFTL